MLTRLQKIINQRGKSVAEVARMMGYTKWGMYNILAERRGITPEFVDKFCTLLGCDEEIRKELHLYGARKAGWKV